MSALPLPVLALSLLDAGPEAAARFREELRAATHDVGFFYLTGTGVSPQLEARLHRAARDFFALPDADKLAIENVTSPHFRGYTRVGGERTQGKVDWREQIDIGPEREAVVDPEAPDFARLIGPNLWPTAQPELREVATAWQEHLTGVARKLLRAWAVAPPACTSMKGARHVPVTCPDAGPRLAAAIPASMPRPPSVGVARV
jgi:isopenicillin N synthase-like dioxygenase